MLSYRILTADLKDTFELMSNIISIFETWFETIGLYLHFLFCIAVGFCSSVLCLSEKCSIDQIKGYNNKGFSVAQNYS